MIICEECGTRNRNDAYVCEECGAGLLHLDATEDDDAAVPMKRKAPLFAPKTRTAGEILPQFEDEENDSEQTTLSEHDSFEQPEAKQAAKSNRRARPLFGKKARLEPEEPPFYEEDEPEQQQETRFDEEPEAAQTQIMESTGAEPISEEQPEPVSEKLTDNEPDNEGTAANEEEPAENTLRFEFEEAGADETPRIEYNTPPSFADLPEFDAAPSSITIDMEVAVFDDEDEEYDDNDGDDEPVRATDFRTAYKTSRRESEGMTRGMIAAIITVSSLLVVTLVVLGVLLIGKHNRNVPVVATMAPAETAAPTAAPTVAPTVAPTPVPTPSPTPVPTTTVTPEEEFSSIFEQPEDGLLAEP